MCQTALHHVTVLVAWQAHTYLYPTISSRRSLVHSIHSLISNKAHFLIFRMACSHHLLYENINVKFFGQVYCSNSSSRESIALVVRRAHSRTRVCLEDHQYLSLNRSLLRKDLPEAQEPY